MATSNAKKTWARPFRAKPARRPNLTPAAQRCRRKFLRFFPDGYHDETYIDWERGYKWSAHERWMKELEPVAFRRLLAEEVEARVDRLRHRRQDRAAHGGGDPRAPKTYPVEVQTFGVRRRSLGDG